MGRYFHDRRRCGFTLVELLVVLAILVVLIALLVPTLQSAYGKAMDVKCRSNLRQIGAYLAVYASENEGRLTFGHWGRSDVAWARGNWITALRPYMPTREHREDVLRCPLATDPRVVGGSTVFYGGPFNTYIMGDKYSAPDERERCSYGINSWLYSPRLDFPLNHIQGRPLALNWLRFGGTGRDKNVPLVLDSMWRGGGVFHKDKRDKPPDYDGQWRGYNYEVGHFCIDRHRGGVNAVFLDLHCRRVGLKELWYLDWHKDYEKGNARWPWPDWMKGYPEFDG